MVWMFSTAQASRVERVGRLRDLGRVELLEKVDPVVELTWEATVVEATAADEAVSWVPLETGRHRLVRLDLLDHEGVAAGELTVFEPFCVRREGLLRVRGIIVPPLPEVPDAIHEHLGALKELELLLNVDDEIGDGGVHLEAEIVREAIIVDARDIFELGFWPLDL